MWNDPGSIPPSHSYNLQSIMYNLQSQGTLFGGHFFSIFLFHFFFAFCTFWQFFLFFKN